MRIDVYTRAVLTVIALLLAVIAAKQYVEPEKVAAQGSVGALQLAVTPLGYSFYDPRSGEIWEYSGATLHSRYKMTKLGQALVPEK